MSFIACHGQSHLVDVVDAEVGLGEVACADGRTRACHLFNHQALRGEQKVGYRVHLLLSLINSFPKTFSQTLYYY